MRCSGLVPLRRVIYTVFLLTVLLSGFTDFLNASAEPTRSDDKIDQYPIQDFLQTVQFTGASFSPDRRKILVSSDMTGIYNAYALPLEGGEPIPLTQSTQESIFVSHYFPTDERFLYWSDSGGNEQSHIYVRELNGERTDLTPGEKVKATFLGWARDDRSFFIETNERDPRFFDVYEVTADGYERRLLFQNDVGYDFADISPNRRYIALSKLETNADSNVYLYDRHTDRLTLLTPHDGEINHIAQTFSTDGMSLYVLTDEGSEFLYLVRYELLSGAREVVLQPAWDIFYAYFSKRGKYLVVGINNDARTELRVYDAASMERIPLPQLPNAEQTEAVISPDENAIAFYASSARMPDDLFIYDFSGTEPKQLTRSLHPNINPERLVDGHIVRFTSYDGVEIPGILYKPHPANAENPAPALVWVHGGPPGQSRLRYHALIQYLVNHGYVIYAINYRGSDGYGKTFSHLDDRKHGSADLDDCVASKQMLIDTGYVHPEKIGIIGGSYGGYLVLAALAFRPKAFSVGVDIFGISNWIRTLKSIPTWWETYRTYLEKELGAFDNDAYFRSISPLFHAENIVTPLMVIQGANDPRVLKAESDDIVAAVRRNGVPVKYIVFDDEGHGFLKRANKARAYQEILNFLDQHLKGTEPHPPSTN
jgi:dipeptidyl aminopeptidase/acylaminoacyl peptidase